MGPVTQMKIFGHEHDFCKYQGINDGKADTKLI